MTFSKALQAKRCAAAADMLLNTEISVCEIAEKVGYENKSFFRKIFKEKYGKNPLEFRKTSSLWAKLSEKNLCFFKKVNKIIISAWQLSEKNVQYNMVYKMHDLYALIFKIKI